MSLIGSVGMGAAPNVMQAQTAAQKPLVHAAAPKAAASAQNTPAPADVATQAGKGQNLDQII
jgi:hypothetical protein